MKKYFIIAASAALVLASCAKVDNVKVAAGEQEISFQAVKAMTTKADEGNHAGHNVFDPTATFGSYAYYYATSTSEGQKYIENEEIKLFGYDAAAAKPEITGTWKAASGTSYYWPQVGTLTFYAYTPYEATSATSKISCKAATGIEATDYTVDPTVDFMVAIPVVGANNNDDTDLHYRDGVSTVFGHKLTKVAFKASVKSGSVAKIYVNDITINKINETGTYAQNAGATEGWTEVKDYAKSYNYINGNTLPLDPSQNDATAYDLGNYGYKYLLPQELVDSEQEVVIKYTVELEGNNGNTISYPYEKTKKLSELLLTWDINKSLVYNIIFDYTPGGENMFEILWDPCVADWDADEEADIVL